MKTFLKTLLAVVLSGSIALGANAPGDIRMSQRNAQNTNYADIVFATGNNSIIGTNAPGLLSRITVGSGLTLDGGVLTATGNGTGNITGATMTANAVILGNGTNSIKALASLGTTGQPLISAGSGAPPAFGTLGVAGGGIGVSTIASGGLMIGNGTGGITTLVGVTTNNVVTWNGTAWTSAAPTGGGSGNITAGNGITVTGSGNVTVATTVRQVVVADTTGATDASAGFNTAINAVATAGGGTVFVPYGTYKVSGISGERILLKGGVRMDFAAGTTISYGNHTAASVIMAIDSATTSTIRNVVIDGNGLTITGNRTSTFSQYGIAINGQTSGDVVSGVTIRNVKIANTRTDGITIGGNSGAQPSNILVQNLWVDNAYRNGGSAIHGTQIAFVDCRFTGTTGSSLGAGFDVEPDTGLSVTDIYFTRCQFSTNAGNGLYAQTALVNRVTVTDCQAISNGSNGFVLNLPSGDAVMSGSVARSNTSDGIYVEALNVNVTGCIAASNGGDGFKAAGSNAANYVNCESYSNTLAGFDILYGSAYTGTQTFTNCTAHDNTTRGVSFNRAVQASFVGGSIYKNLNDGVQFYEARNCLLANNYIAQNGILSDLNSDNVVVESNSVNNQIIGNKVSQALRFFSGTATAGGSATVTLPATRYTQADSYYNGMTVRITGGTGSGQTKTISSYVAATGVVTVSTSWSTNPDNTSTLQITGANRPRYGIRLNSANNSNQVIANDTTLSGGTGTLSDAGTSNTVTDFTGTTLTFASTAWATGRGALQIYDGTADTRVVAALASDTPTNGQVPTWNTGGTITWETPGTGSGNVTNSGTLVSGNIVMGGGTTVVTATNATYSASNNTSAGILLGNGTGSITTLVGGTTGNVVTWNGTAWTSAAVGTGNVTGASLTSGSLVVGGGSNAITVTTTGTGVVTALGINANAAGGVVTTNGTATLTGKRITARITTITSSATPTINTDDADAVTITALAAAITSMSTNLSGTPVNFDQLIFRIKDDGTARAITWGASFEACGAALPTTTVISKRLYVLFIYDSVAGKWGCVSTAQES